MKVLVLGATGGIARAFCARAVEEGWELILAGRNMVHLKLLQKDLEARSGTQSFSIHSFDLLDLSSYGEFLAGIIAKQGPLDGCFLATGIMHPQEKCQENSALIMETLATNFTHVVCFLEELAKHFSSQKAGFISCVTSVAGDRGRRANYIYGSSKGGLSLYLQGLRSRMQAQGVLIQDVRPGPVRTRMTEGLDSLPFLVDPFVVANDIVRAIKKKKDILYTPRIWQPIMALVRSIPEKIYKRMNF